MIRLATSQDQDDLFRMASLFKASSPYCDLPVEEEKVHYFIRRLLSDDKTSSIVLVAEKDNKIVGMIAGGTAEFLWNTQKHASEIVWWVDPEYRKSKAGLLLKSAFEYWAKNVAGCTHVHMASLDEKVQKYYEKDGYKQMESSFLKAL